MNERNRGENLSPKVEVTSKLLKLCFHTKTMALGQLKWHFKDYILKPDKFHAANCFYTGVAADLCLI